MRRGAGSEISLFSFQDIMASVIGMLFFIVLMLARAIVEHKSAALAAAEPATVEAAGVRTRAEEHKQAIARLEQEARTQAQTIANLPSGQQALEETRKLHNRLVAAYEKIRGANKELEGLGQSLDERQKDYYEKVRGAWRLTKDIEQLKDRIQLAADSPRVAYIVDEQTRLEPFLLEVAAGSLRVATRDGNFVTEFEGDSLKKRHSQLLAWAKDQNPRTHYFVLLMKPSGVTEAYQLAEDLHERGFDFGTDLLPEGWSPF